MRALLKPRIQRPGAHAYVVKMLARTGKDKIVVQGLREGANPFAAERWRLYSETDRDRRITDVEFATLEWNGKAGTDPLALDAPKARP